MKHLYLCTMMLAAFVSATAQTKQLFDNGWKFTHEGKSISTMPQTRLLAPAAPMAVGILAARASIARCLPHPRARL